MNWKNAVSGRTVALTCVFAFLLARLLLGCDREPPQGVHNPSNPVAGLSATDGQTKPVEPQ
ncbi:MAG: hypothetical protein OEL83_17780 [Desulforhopalus sp.]|nr:hypothetical protein [Desulforhopalus sp.]